MLVAGLLLVGGCLSTPRDFASPRTIIRVVDQSGAPISGVEVSRDWYDSDCKNDGHETMVTGQTGTAQFSKVPASVGVLTGAWRKTYTNLGMCGSGSGTWTTIYVRFAGHYEVVPKDKPLRLVSAQTYQDADGVSFYVSADSRSNTVAHLSFPTKTKVIEYVLSSKAVGER